QPGEHLAVDPVDRLAALEHRLGPDQHRIVGEVLDNLVGTAGSKRFHLMIQNRSGRHVLPPGPANMGSAFYPGLSANTDLWTMNTILRVLRTVNIAGARRQGLRNVRARRPDLVGVSTARLDKRGAQLFRHGVSESC